MKSRLENCITTALGSLVKQGIVPNDIPHNVSVTHSKNREHGDFSSNIALILGQSIKRNPRQVAEALIAELPTDDVLHKVEIAGPGFINFFVTRESMGSMIEQIIESGSRYGHTDDGKGRSVQVEFVSANPTGPLHLGHGRAAAIGECLCRLLAATGWRVTSEYYYNDAGQQINNLALSVQARAKGFGTEHTMWPQDGYQGDYIKDIATAYLAGESVDAGDRHVVGSGNFDDLDAIREFAVAYLRREQDRDLASFGVSFDHYYLESSLYTTGKVAEMEQLLLHSGCTYEKDGAIWLETTAFGDDKNRVLKKANGEFTYFATDVAYHLDKWRRGFLYVINEHGADHHGTIARVRAGIQAISNHLDLRIPKDWPEYVLHQMIIVSRSGVEQKLAKRSGNYVTLKEIVAEVGRDATRYFLAARPPNSQLVFDIDLALSTSNDNPVYYIQYAHARICSVFRQLAEKQLEFDLAKGLSCQIRLDSDIEEQLADELARFPDVVQKAAQKREPHLIANFLQQLASVFHAWYNTEQFIVTDKDLRDARLARCMAVKIVIVNGLDILGVSAPEAM